MLRDSGIPTAKSLHGLNICEDLAPILKTWINFNLSVDK